MANNIKTRQVYDFPPSGIGFLVECDTAESAVGAVNNRFPIGQHRGGFIYERIDAEPMEHKGVYGVTLTYSRDFGLRCGYAGRPIVLPETPNGNGS